MFEASYSRSKLRVSQKWSFLSPQSSAPIPYDGARVAPFDRARRVESHERRKKGGFKTRFREPLARVSKTHTWTTLGARLGTSESENGVGSRKEKVPPHVSYHPSDSHPHLFSLIFELFAKTKRTEKTAENGAGSEWSPRSWRVRTIILSDRAPHGLSFISACQRRSSKPNEAINEKPVFRLFQKKFEVTYRNPPTVTKKIMVLRSRLSYMPYPTKKDPRLYLPGKYPFRNQSISGQSFSLYIVTSA